MFQIINSQILHLVKEASIKKPILPLKRKVVELKEKISPIYEEEDGIRAETLQMRIGKDGKSQIKPRTHYCWICNDDREHSKIVRHWTETHLDHPDVLKFIKGMDKLSKERKKKIQDFKFLGDHQ